MPAYDYQCPDCGARYESSHAIAAVPPTCPAPHLYTGGTWVEVAGPRNGDASLARVRKGLSLLSMNRALPVKKIRRKSLCKH